MIAESECQSCGGGHVVANLDGEGLVRVGPWSRAVKPHLKGGTIVRVGEASECPACRPARRPRGAEALFCLADNDASTPEVDDWALVLAGVLEQAYAVADPNVYRKRVTELLAEYRASRAGKAKAA